jgi:hypothetical protein
MKNIVVILFLASFLQGCEENSITESIKTRDGLVQWNIAKVEGPISATVNQAVVLEVTYPTSSGCDLVSQFGTTSNDNCIYVKAFGKTLNDSPCTLAAIPKKIDFLYTPTVKGDFIFKFLKTDNSYIEHILRVE